MGTFILIVCTLAYMLVCCFLIIVVLMQEGKGGGVSGMLTGGASPLSETLGAYGAEQTLRKWTKYSAVGFMALAIFLTVFAPFLMRPKSLAEGLTITPPASQTATPPPAPAPEEAPAVSVAPEGTPTADALPAANIVLEEEPAATAPDQPAAPEGAAPAPDAPAAAPGAGE